MAFTYDPTTDRGKTRLLLHDTTDGTYGTDYDFSDADIDALLEQNSDDVWLSAAEGCRIMAAKNASSALSLNISGAISIDKKKVAEMWLDLSKKYESRAYSGSEGVVEFVDAFDRDIDVLGQDRSEYVGDL